MTIRRYALAGLTLAVASLATGCAASEPEPEPSSATSEGPDVSAPDLVTFDDGTVRGTVTEDHRLFEGIPYAAPPVGERRWAAPEAPEPWDDVRDATEPGSPCPQVGASYADVSSTDEDCLFLNVTTPGDVGSNGDDEAKPVMVWLHGDGATGAGHFFDAARLAAQGDVVVVTVNYRLGVFGFFGHPDLEGSGSFGLQDQQEALRWVQRNAEAFGGDPDNVTLFGMSYGGMAVNAHLTAPESEGLFHRAIIQSGEGMMDMVADSMGPGIPAAESYAYRSPEEIAGLGEYFSAQTACTDPATALACLRELDVAEILAVPQVMNLFQIYGYGNATLPESPMQRFRAGEVHEVPVISGGTRDEHRIFAGLFYDAAGNPMTAEQYRQFLDTAFGSDATTVAAEYPVDAYESPAIAWATVLTDRMWARGTHEQTSLLSERMPTYSYEFADENAPMFLPVEGDFPFGAFHAGDHPYLFRDEGAEPLFTDEQRDLSAQMIAYWTNFAHDGDPNGDDLPKWERFDADDDVPVTLSLAPGATEPVDYAAEHNLDFWSRLP